MDQKRVEADKNPKNEEGRFQVAADDLGKLVFGDKH